MRDAGALSAQLSTCPLCQRNPELFAQFVENYRDIVQIAVQEAASGTGQQVFAKVRTLARRAGDQDALPQDLIAVHLSALAILVKTKPNSILKACVRHSRLLLVKMLGELALYYRDAAKAKVSS